MSIYYHFLARGRDVVYPKDMPMLIGLGIPATAKQRMPQHFCGVSLSGRWPTVKGCPAPSFVLAILATERSWVLSARAPVELYNDEN